MGDKVVIYRKKVEHNLEESYKHLNRLNGAFDELGKVIHFPLNKKSFDTIVASMQTMAYSDQIIYRFAKLQDVMGVKLFKSVLVYQGENVNKPFLDLLNQLELIEIVDVNEWFEIRDLRNEIAHDYEDNDALSIDILNAIYKLKIELEHILDAIKNMIS